MGHGLEGLQQNPLQCELDELPEIAPNCVRLTLISDTHERHSGFVIPPCDVLIHCGDILASSTYATQDHVKDVLKDFSDWLAMAPCQHRVVIPGNHDIGISSLGGEAIKTLLPQASFLEFETLELRIARAEAAAVASKDQDSSLMVKIYGAPLSRGKSVNRNWQGREAEEAMERNMPDMAD